MAGSWAATQNLDCLNKNLLQAFGTETPLVSVSLA